MSDAWDDEGFSGEDDWEGKESVETDLEDADDLDPDADAADDDDDQ
jgi:hypothetical protein